MNFFPGMVPIPNGNMVNNDFNYLNTLFNKISELENRLQKVEGKLKKITDGNKNNMHEPDNSFYMI